MQIVPRVHLTESVPPWSSAQPSCSSLPRPSPSRNPRPRSCLQAGHLPLKSLRSNPRREGTEHGSFSPPLTATRAWMCHCTSSYRKAYGVFDDSLLTGGPPWVDTDRFDLEAKFDPGSVPNAKDLTYRQRADMLRSVLADRFQLKVHLAKKDFPVFNLVVAKGGPKMPVWKSGSSVDVDAPKGCLFRRSGASFLDAENFSVDALLLHLRYITGRNVLDKTALTGHYHLILNWTPENTPADSPIAGGPSIFTALQEQLGLKLEPSTAPLDILIIDSAKKPSVN